METDEVSGVEVTRCHMDDTIMNCASILVVNAFVNPVPVNIDTYPLLASIVIKLTPVVVFWVYLGCSVCSAVRQGHMYIRVKHHSGYCW